MNPCISFTGNGSIGFFPDPPSLEKEGSKGKKQKDDGKNRRHTLVCLSPGNCKKDLGRKDFITSSKNQGIPEIGKTFNETQKKCISDSWPHQRE